MRFDGNSRFGAQLRAEQKLQIQDFFKADPAYGTGVAKGLGLNIDEVMASERDAVTAR